MILRRCTMEDKAIWAEMNKACMEEELGENAFWAETREKGLQKLEDSFEVALGKEPSIILLVFEEDGQVVGFVNLNTIYSVWSVGEVIVVDNFFISKEYRDRGLGKEGLVLVEKFAIDEGYKRIQFTSDMEDEHIISVWEDFGYNPMDVKFYMRYI